MEREEPGIRNSNLLPVKAMGDVRLRSVLSWGIEGITSTPMSRLRFLLPFMAVSLMMESTTALSSLPRKMDTTAGGASCAPRR